MKRLHTLALLLVTTLAITTLPALASDKNAQQITKTITMHHITSEFILRYLGLSVLGTPMPSDQQPAQIVKPDGAPIKMTDNSGLLPTEVTSITPIGPKALSITASPEAHAKAAALIDQMDVKPRVVQIVAEYYEVDSELAQDLNRIEGQPATQPAQGVPSQRAFRDKLKASGLNPLATATLSTLSYTKGECTSHFSVPPSGTSADDNLRTLKAALSATPKIHSDGTITMCVSVSFTSWHWISDRGFYEQRTQSLNTARRSASGEPIVAGGFTCFTGKETIIILTATVQD